jgi:hypothetical protein
MLLDLPWSANPRPNAIVLKPGPTGQPGTWQTRGWNRVEEKIEKEKTRCDRAKPGQKPGCNPLTFVFFCFLLKRCRFDFFFKKN